MLCHCSLFNGHFSFVAVGWPGLGDTASHWLTQYRCFLPDLAGFQAPIAQPPGPAKTRAPTDKLALAMDSARGQAGSQTETERVGFEPTVESPPHTLSKRAP